MPAVIETAMNQMKKSVKEISMNDIRIFNFNPADYRDTWLKQGYLHIRNGLNPSFFSRMSESVLAEIQSPLSELGEWEITAKKSQHLFEFDAEFAFPSTLYEDVAALTGLDLKRLTLCERHIKSYKASADPAPMPHKDRQASEVVIGMPVRVSDDSYLALYPTAPLSENPYQSTAKWRNLDCSEARTLELIDGQEPVKIYAHPGDLVVFQGARTFHERVNAANSVLLFLKFNALRMDPIGEDPSTAHFEERTANIVDAIDDEALMNERIELSPRLETVLAQFNRRDWRPLYQAALWGQKEIVLDECEMSILRIIDRGEQTVASVMKSIRDYGFEAGAASVRRLCRERLVILADKFPYQMSRSNNGQ